MTTPTTYQLADGLGERRIAADPSYGLVEVLELAPELAARPGVAALIGQRAAQLDPLDGVVAHVHAVARQGAGVFVTADLPRGVRLSTLLTITKARPERVSDAMVLHIALAMTRSLAALHRHVEPLVHGAICPDHVVLTADGDAVFTDAAFGAVLPLLEFSRERVWKGFGLALPSAASLPRFDQRADVSQLAAVVLATAVRRRLAESEFPRAVPELLAAVMVPAEPDIVERASQFRAWLQRALQLPSRGVFASAIEAEQVLAPLAGASNRETRSAVSALVRELTMPEAGGTSAQNFGGHFTRSA
jgi:hypothetical protein